MLRAKRGHASPWTPCSAPTAEMCTPLQNWGAAGTVQQASQPPARRQPHLPGAWETKGSRNQTIFPLNLISSFSLTPPQLEVE